MENFQHLFYLGWVSKRQEEKGRRELITGIENTAENIFIKMNILGIRALWNTQKKFKQKPLKCAQTYVTVRFWNSCLILVTASTEHIQSAEISLYLIPEAQNIPIMLSQLLPSKEGQGIQRKNSSLWEFFLFCFKELPSYSDDNKMNSHLNAEGNKIQT